MLDRITCIKRIEIVGYGRVCDPSNSRSDNVCERWKGGGVEYMAMKISQFFEGFSDAGLSDNIT